MARAFVVPEKAVVPSAATPMKLPTIAVFVLPSKLCIAIPDELAMTFRQLPTGVLPSQPINVVSLWNTLTLMTLVVGIVVWPSAATPT